MWYIIILLHYVSGDVDDTEDLPADAGDTDFIRHDGHALYAGGQHDDRPFLRGGFHDGLWARQPGASHLCRLWGHALRRHSGDVRQDHGRRRPEGHRRLLLRRRDPGPYGVGHRHDPDPAVRISPLHPVGRRKKRAGQPGLLPDPGLSSRVHRWRAGVHRGADHGAISAAIRESRPARFRCGAHDRVGYRL